LHLVVCLKQILDPEIPPSEFRLDAAARQAAAGGSLVISIFDENALEVALQLRDSAGGGTITALSVGPPTATDALRKALSMRADQAILIPQEEFANLDVQGTARVLAAAIRKLEPADAIFCGRESGDWHGGLAAGFLAAELDIPYTAFVAGVSKESAGLKLRRQTDNGWEIVQTTTPAVISVTNDDHNLPRIPKVKDNMMAFRKQIPVWTAESLGLNKEAAAGRNSDLETARLYIPAVDPHCEMISGENTDQKIAQFMSKLQAMQVI
jgi:electron transfer flavoprotein beta subunit